MPLDPTLRTSSVHPRFLPSFRDPFASPLSLSLPVPLRTFSLLFSICLIHSASPSHFHLPVLVPGFIFT